MTNLEKIGYFLEGNLGISFCDDCLALHCRINNRRMVQAITRRLEFDPHYKRSEGLCRTCTAKCKKTIQEIVRPAIAV